MIHNDYLYHYLNNSQKFLKGLVKLKVSLWNKKGESSKHDKGFKQGLKQVLKCCTVSLHNLGGEGTLL